MDSTTASSTLAVKPTSVKHWSKWIEALRQTPEGQNVWHEVDPDMLSQDSNLLKEPAMPASTVTFHEYVKRNTTAVYTPSMLETIQYYNVIHQEECRKYKTRRRNKR
ncbi:hypothetical protein E4U17_007387 [Claviceps sp. LM77 group G4]|nr:hypothetical protein E4U17_007387 [Claviceps sp. LM77 group G4]KAG6080411.1 hypothetical protein E4U33_007667 [Claviceps sp. LM78 group G4]